MKAIPYYPKSLFPEPNALPWNFRQFLRIFWPLWRLPSVWWQHSRYSLMFPNPAQCHPLLTPSQRSFHTKNRRFYPKSCPWQLQGWTFPHGNLGYSGITPWTQGDPPRAGNSRLLLLPKAGGFFFFPIKNWYLIPGIKLCRGWKMQLEKYPRKHQDRESNDVCAQKEEGKDPKFHFFASKISLWDLQVWEEAKIILARSWKIRFFYPKRFF